MDEVYAGGLYILFMLLLFFVCGLVSDFTLSFSLSSSEYYACMSDCMCLCAAYFFLGFFLHCFDIRTFKKESAETPSAERRGTNKNYIFRSRSL